MTGFVHRFAWAPLALSLAACMGGEERPLQGYVEGTYVYIAAEGGGRVVTRPVTAGTRIAASDVLFRLDDSNEREAIAGAEARLAQAEAQLSNLKTGQRKEEVSVLAANLAAARTTLAAAEEDYARKVLLRERQVVAQSVVDDARAKRDTTKAQRDAAERQVEVASLPARPEEIEAAERNVAVQRSALAQAHIQLDRRLIRSPSPGMIEETFFEPGELVSAGQPVVSLLPDANRKVRFFVPQAQLAATAVGRRVSVSCDGCPAGLTATIDFVATAAEYTPPVIYSKESREKLVYRVEARPAGDAVQLKIGQPLDVRLTAETGS